MILLLFCVIKHDILILYIEHWCGIEPKTLVSPCPLSYCICTKLFVLSSGGTRWSPSSPGPTSMGGTPRREPGSVSTLCSSSSDCLFQCCRAWTGRSRAFLTSTGADLFKMDSGFMFYYTVATRTESQNWIQLRGFQTHGAGADHKRQSRRIKTEEKAAKVVASVGGEFIQFLIALGWIAPGW